LMVACNRHPLVMGKPEPYMLDLLVEEHKLSRERTCMVGDRLDTDILFGIKGNIKTLLVYTGINTREDVLHPNNTIHPQYNIESFGTIYPLYNKAKSHTNSQSTPTNKN